MTEQRANSDAMVRLLVLAGVLACVVAMPGPLGMLVALPALALLMPGALLARVTLAGTLLILGLMLLPLTNTSAATTTGRSARATSSSSAWR